jgi:hypothetical protein
MSVFMPMPCVVIAETLEYVLEIVSMRPSALFFFVRIILAVDDL